MWSYKLEACVFSRYYWAEISPHAYLLRALNRSKISYETNSNLCAKRRILRSKIPSATLIFHSSKKRKKKKKKIQSYPRFSSRRFPLNSCDADSGNCPSRSGQYTAFVYLYAHTDSAKQQQLNAPRETVGIVEKKKPFWSQLWGSR